MKNIALLFTLVLASCSASLENYYLNTYDLETKNLQNLASAEIAFNNVIYAKVLSKTEAKKQFGERAENYSVVFFSVENIGQDVSFFSFKNALILNDNKSRGRINVDDELATGAINLEKQDVYRNPFENVKLEVNNFAYALSQKVLNDFSLDPNAKKHGFLIFKKLKGAQEMKFSLSSGVSVYTSRMQTIGLDSE